MAVCRNSYEQEWANFCYSSIISISKGKSIRILFALNTKTETCLHYFVSRSNEANAKTFYETNQLQKQPSANVHQNSCSWKFRNIHRKTSTLETLFNKVAILQTCIFIKKRLHHWFFHLNIAKFFRRTFLREHLRHRRRCIWTIWCSYGSGKIG